MFDKDLWKLIDSLDKKQDDYSYVGFIFIGLTIFFYILPKFSGIDFPNSIYVLFMIACTVFCIGSFMIAGMIIAFQVAKHVLHKEIKEDK